MDYYTGVGSRKTPIEIQRLMYRVACKLRRLGYTLRSGGALGADTAFETGAGKAKCIFYANQANDASMEIARRHHPAWNRCSPYARRLHARNAFQVLGHNLDSPSNFLICWTPDGAWNDDMRSIQTGGTGTAISIADTYNVPVFNLKFAPHFERLSEMYS